MKSHSTPYIDLFKYYNVFSFDFCEKQGEIKPIQDKTIGRKVLQVFGDVSAKNYLKFPTKTSKKPFPDCKFLYFLTSFPLGGLNAFSIEIKHQNQSYFLHFSTLFKSTKKCQNQYSPDPISASNSLQIPLKPQNNHWTILILDIASFLSTYFEVFDDSWKVLSIKLCANMLVKSVLSSNRLFCLEEFPMEIKFKVNKDETFLEKYNYVLISEDQNKENVLLPMPKNSENQEKPNKTKKNINNKENKGPLFNNNIINNEQKEKKSDVNEEKVKPIMSKQRAKSSNNNNNEEEEIIKHPPIKKKVSFKLPESPSSRKHSNSDIKNNVNQNSFKTINSHDLYPIIQPPQPTPHEYQMANEQTFELNPNPIMSLQHIQGYSGLSKSLKSVTNNKILYSLGPSVILHDLNLNKQSYFFQRSMINSEIKCFTYCLENKLLITSTNQSLIQFWDYNTTDLLPVSFQSTIRKIKTLTLVYDFVVNPKKSTRKFKLILTGDDEHQRVCIQILQYSPQNQSLQLLHKQISDWEITHFNPINPLDSSKGFISMGTRNLRIWKLNRLSENYVLQGSNINVSNDFYANSSVLLTDFKIIPLNKSEKPADETEINMIVSASNGFIYVLSLTSKGPLAVFRLASTGIVSLAYCPIRCLVASSFEDSSVTIWKSDFSSSVLEGKLESQATSMDFIPAGLLTGSLNGSIGVIALEDQKFKTLVRSHTDDILGLEYNSFLKKIVTISKDSTIRLWGIKGRSGLIEESYEFRCFDDEVCKIRSMNNEGSIFCGFKGGLIRMFNLRNYSIQCELLRHKSEITTLDIDCNDKFLMVIERKMQNMVLYLVNDKANGFDEIKSIALRSLLSPEENQHRCFGGFDKNGDYFYLLNDSGYTLELFSMRSFELLYSISLPKEATTLVFSKFPNHIFMLSLDGSLSRYVIRKDVLTLFREYPALHSGEINNWRISKNSCFNLSSGEDRLIKVWDYNLRGYLTPYFQCFYAGEIMGDLRFSDDENGMVFGFGKESRGIYVWKFERGLVEDDDCEENDGYFGGFYNGNEGEKLLETRKFITTLMKDEKKESLCENILENNRKDKNNTKIITDLNLNNGECFENKMPGIKKNDLVEERKIQNEKMKENIEKIYESQFYNKNALKNEEQEEINNEIPLLGRYVYWNSQLGFNTKMHKSLLNAPNSSSLIWNTLHKYIACLCGPMIVITYLQNPKTQKKIMFETEVLQIYQTPNQKTLVMVTENLQFSLFSAKTLQKLGEFNLFSSSSLIFATISPCNTYILTLSHLKTEKCPLLNIFEIGTCALISSSQIKELGDSDICCAKWTQNLELFIISSKILQVWRLTNKRSLEYQNLSLPKHSETLQKYGFFSSIQLIDTISSNSLIETVVLLGSTIGSLYIIDSRTGSLLCLLASVVQGPILEIWVNNGKRIIIKSNNQNVYSWGLKQENLETIEKLGDLLQLPPETLVLDSSIISMTQGQICEGHSDDQMMTITKSGTLWLLDFNESTTIKLFSSHLTEKNIVETLVSEDFIMKKLLVFSVSKDGSIKVWDLENLELISEIINPRKECLSVAINETFGVLISGYSDGTLGFFDYRNNINIGTSKLSEEKIQILALTVLQKSVNNLLISLGNGDVYMGFLENIDGKMRLDLGLVLKGLESPILKILSNDEEELNEWLMLDLSGKVTVWNRKDLTRIPKKNIVNIHEIEVYLIDSYKPSPNEDFSLRKNNKNYMDLKFAKQPNVYVSLSSNGANLIVRNYREHVNLRVIEMKVRGCCFCLNDKGNYLFVGCEKGNLSMFDFNLGLEIDRVEGNGKANLETICFWEKKGLQTYENERKPVLLSGSLNNIMVFGFV